MCEQTFKNIDDILHKDAGRGRVRLRKTANINYCKYKSFEDAREVLGNDLGKLSTMFVEFQKHLYEQKVA